MESPDGGGTPSCVDGGVPGLGEVERLILLPGPGGGVEGGGSQERPHGGADVSGSIELPPPRGGRSLDHV